jgi:two-component system invasion response regulator UvrY
VIRILVADDHPIVRQGLKQIIADSPDMVVTAEAADGQEVLNQVWKNEFDVVLLDISMPVRNGLDILKQLKSQKPGLAVLLLSVHPEEQYALRALKAGASGYITKDRAPEELISAIRTVASGKKYVSPSLAQILAATPGMAAAGPPHQLLSDREYSVLRSIAAGKAKKAIAEELSLSPKTVSTYRSRLLKKMGLKTDAEIVRYAIENRLIGWVGGNPPLSSRGAPINRGDVAIP